MSVFVIPSSTLCSHEAPGVPDDAYRIPPLSLSLSVLAPGEHAPPPGTLCVTSVPKNERPAHWPNEQKTPNQLLHVSCAAIDKPFSRLFIAANCSEEMWSNDTPKRGKREGKPRAVGGETCLPANGIISARLS
jgi:hypothetical protein